MNKIIIIVTGASSGFGLMAAQVEAVKAFAADNKADLRAIEMDVVSQSSVDAAIASRPTVLRLPI